MYVKLIEPKMRMRPMDTGLKTRMAPPLGLLTIAGLLREKHRVKIENENVESVVFDDEPDIVGISVTVDVLPRAMEIAARFRARGILVAAGGIHITTAESTIPRGAFDILMIGAAEGTWPDLMQDLESGTPKSLYRCRGAAALASPAYDMIDHDKYLYCNVVSASRGCPYRCDFCYNSAAAHGFRTRPIDDVLRDVLALRRRHVMFIDDNLIGDPAYALALARALKPLHLKWNAAVSADILNMPKLLDEMCDSGLQSLFIGFESVNPTSLRGVNKIKNDPGKYELLVEALHKRGVMINASFVFGLDGDMPDTFRETLRFIVKNKIETVTSHILTPYPGTAFYRRMESENRIDNRDLSLYNTANVVFKPKNMTKQQLYDGYLWIYRHTYSFYHILRRLPRTRRQIAPYLAFNLLYRKFGRFSDWLCRLLSYGLVGRLGEKLARYPHEDTDNEQPSERLK